MIHHVAKAIVLTLLPLAAVVATVYYQWPKALWDDAE